MIIAVDFDGTIVEHRYPEIGKEIPFAIDTLKRLQAERNILILWTSREGRLLQEAIDFCASRGLEFYAVNSNHPEEYEDEAVNRSRKIKADLYIDDRNLGGLPDWGVIYDIVTNRWTYEEYLSATGHPLAPQPRPGFWSRLFAKNRRR
ncbi:MAG: BT0820 family HAD-type phosphatase [Candidatus Cryptobacteroides sp.]